MLWLGNDYAITSSEHRRAIAWGLVLSFAVEPLFLPGNEGMTAVGGHVREQRHAGALACCSLL